MAWTNPLGSRNGSITCTFSVLKLRNTRTYHSPRSFSWLCDQPSISWNALSCACSTDIPSSVENPLAWRALLCDVWENSEESVRSTQRVSALLHLGGKFPLMDGFVMRYDLLLFNMGGCTSSDVWWIHDNWIDERPRESKETFSRKVDMEMYIIMIIGLTRHLHSWRSSLPSRSSVILYICTTVYYCRYKRDVCWIWLSTLESGSAAMQRQIFAHV